MRKSLALGQVVLALCISACNKGQPLSLSPAAREAALMASTESCQNFVKRLQDDFKDVPGAFYDYLTVPEDPKHPQGTQIKIFYYGRLVKGRTPVVFFNGGPAGNSHSSYSILTRQQRYAADWSRIPFIFIDQRGTGCSDAYPQGSGDLDLERLTHYGTRGIVADAEAIREHLGVAKWKIFGQSYGAFLVHRYFTLAPQSIVAAYAHAGIITSDPLFRLVGRIRSQNRVLERYFYDYPEDRNVLAQLNAKLTLQKCYEHDGFDPVCGQAVLAPLMMELGFSDDWLNLHLQLNLLIQNGEIQASHMHDYLRRYVFTDAEQGRSSGVASDVIGWNDRNVLSSGKSDCQNVYKVLIAEGGKPENWLLNECTASLQKTEDDSDPLDAHIRKTISQDLMTIQDFKSALKAHPEIPFYLYSGSKDAYVPADDYTEELSQVQSLIHYTNFSGTGHDGFYSEPQVWEDLVSI